MIPGKRRSQTPKVRSRGYNYTESRVDGGQDSPPVVPEFLNLFHQRSTRKTETENQLSINNSLNY